MAFDLINGLQPLAGAFLAGENDDSAELVHRLQKLGLEEAEAKQWSVLMPLAFARVAYHFQLPELYDPSNDFVLCHLPSGESKTLSLSELAPFLLAKQWASNCGMMDSISSPEYNAIVRRSQEFEAIQSLRSGAINTLPPLEIHL